MNIIDERFQVEADDCFYGGDTDGNKEVGVTHTGEKVALNLEVKGEPLGLYFSRVQAARLAALLEAVSRQPTVAEIEALGRSELEAARDRAAAVLGRTTQEIEAFIREAAGDE